MEITKYLETHREPMPIWLSDFKSESDFDRTAFFQSRVIYYPGHGGDGHPIKLFGGSHSAHCFLMVDSLLTESQLVDTLDSEQTAFRGYHSLFRRKLKQTEVQPAAWTPHVSAPITRLHDHIFNHLAYWKFWSATTPLTMLTAP